MRIAQMLDTLSWGGAQKMQLFLVQNLCPLGIDITVISLSFDPASPLPKELEAAGARVITFSFPRLFSPLPFIKLLLFLRREKFDLIQGYLTYSNIIGALAAKLVGTPFLGSFRTSGRVKSRTNKYRIMLETFLLRNFAKSIIANGYSVAEFGNEQIGYDIPIKILPNAIDPDKLPKLSPPERQELRRNLLLDPGRPLLLSVARLTPQKGFEYLLEAFLKVKILHPRAALVIAGDGRLYDNLMKQIGELGLQNHVFLLGQRDDVPELLSVADIYVSSSLVEGTPVTILEAMSAELPIIATSVGDIPYLLNAESAIIVPPAQPDALAIAMDELLSSPEKCANLAKVAKQRVQEEYSPLRWRQNLINLYAEIVPVAKRYLHESGN